MSLRTKGMLLALLLSQICLVGTLLMAQEQQPAPKWELFGGYSWSDPNATLHAVPSFSGPGITAGTPLSAPLKDQRKGFGTALTYNMNRWFGLTADFSAHFGGDRGNLFSASHTDDANMYTIGFGPKVTFRGEHVSPFIELLGGWNRLTPDGFDKDSRFGFLAGGGVDIDFTKHWSWRVIQGDYIHSDHRFGPGTLVDHTRVRGARLQTGVVYKLGGGPPPSAPAASCSASPTEVMTGEPVKVTATPSNFPKNRTLAYSWSSTGGKISGNEAIATVDTTGLAGGSYTATAKITDNKKSNAECSANFTVKEPAKNPPTISCSANPSTVKSGEASTITCDCKSPDGRQVSLSNWTASSGKISGTGNTATLDTAGAAAGAINVSATCSDDRGLTAQGSASVTVENPPPAPTASKVCEFEFNNKAKPARVDNAAKGCLDGAADSLLNSPNSKAVLVGEQGEKEKPKAPKLAAQRAVNAKAYLTSGENQKAVDPSRIEPRTGSATEQKVEVWVIPEGATFDQPGTSAVDEAKVKGQSRTAAPAKKARKKAAPAT